MSTSNTEHEPAEPTTDEVMAELAGTTKSQPDPEVDKALGISQDAPPATMPNMYAASKPQKWESWWVELALQDAVKRPSWHTYVSHEGVTKAWTEVEQAAAEATAAIEAVHGRGAKAEVIHAAHLAEVRRASEVGEVIPTHPRVPAEIDHDTAVEVARGLCARVKTARARYDDVVIEANLGDSLADAFSEAMSRALDTAKKAKAAVEAAVTLREAAIEAAIEAGDVERTSLPGRWGTMAGSLTEVIGLLETVSERPLVLEALEPSRSERQTIANYGDYRQRLWLNGIEKRERFKKTQWTAGMKQDAMYGW